MAKKRKQKPGNKQEALSDALQRMQDLLPEAAYQALLEELAQPLRQAIRINPLKVDPQTVISQWEKRFGWQTIPIPYCETGYWIDEAQTPISKPLQYHFGQYYIQDAASMLPVELFDFETDNPLVLDMAASPGGKTTHILSRIKDRGFVLANDASKSRLTALQLVLQNWGGLNVGVTAFNGESFGQWYPDTFDAVLLDAPCSMQNLRNTDNHPMRAITDSERQNLAGRQLRLLESALQAVRPGGEVVYATCTLSPEEDEMVLEQIKKKLGHQIEIVNMNSRLPQPATALATLAGMEFDAEVSNGLRIWPHLFHTSGFFSAKIRKHVSWQTEAAHAAPSRDMGDLGWLPLPASREKQLCEIMQDDYGLDLNGWRDDHEVVFYQYQEKVFAFPERYFQFFDGLPLQMLGLLLGKFQNELFVLEHDFVTRFFEQFHHGKLILPSGMEPSWLRGEDIHEISFEGQYAGKIMLTCNEAGEYIGLGKLTSNRYRNLLPRRLIL